MFSITCEDIAKRYLKEVLFKDFSYTFEQNSKYAVLGPNSSGKSTLLKIISRVLAPTKGDVRFTPVTSIEQAISFCSPELQLFDDFSVRELFELHYQFKKQKIEIKQQWESANLLHFLDKKYSELSSGLKNKVKLSLALFTDSPALLLDEPCTNFDDDNTAWYHAVINEYCQDQLIIVASNQEIEYKFCSEHVNLNDYKPDKK